jgi:hypothetical protein
MVPHLEIHHGSQEIKLGARQHVRRFLPQRRPHAVTCDGDVNNSRCFSWGVHPHSAKASPSRRSALFVRSSLVLYMTKHCLSTDPGLSRCPGLDYGELASRPSACRVSEANVRMGCVGSHSVSRAAGGRCGECARGIYGYDGEIERWQAGGSRQQRCAIDPAAPNRVLQ